VSASRLPSAPALPNTGKYGNILAEDNEKGVFMKKSEFVKPPITCRLAAAFLLVSFLSMTCQTPDSPEEKPNTGIPKGWIVDPPPPPEFPLKRTPVVFFLDDEYVPTAVDTGRTGLMAAGGMPDEQTLISSEDGGAEPVVRFFGASLQETGIALTTASLSFANKESLFPYKAQVIQRRGTEEYTANVAFSEYNWNTQTFSVTYEYGLQTFDNLVLNKEVFGAYLFSDEVSESQNIRMRNAVVAMALWVSLEIQGEQLGLAAALPRYEVNENGAAMYLSGGKKSVVGWIFTGIAVVAFATAFIICPPVAFSVVASPGGISILGTALVSSTAGAVAVGIGLAASVAAAVCFALDSETSSPPENRTKTGQRGPAGGTLIDKCDSKLDYNLEVIPYTADTTLTFSQARALNPTIGGYSGWKLPTLDELSRIYSLYLMYGMITFSSFSPLATTEGWLWTRTEIQSQSNPLSRGIAAAPSYAWALNLGIQATGDNFNQNFRSSDQSSYLAACLVRVVD
jgi:hypothetical protein